MPADNFTNSRRSTVAIARAVWHSWRRAAAFLGVVAVFVACIVVFRSPDGVGDHAARSRFLDWSLTAATVTLLVSGVLLAASLRAEFVSSSRGLALTQRQAGPAATHWGLVGAACIFVLSLASAMTVVILIAWTLHFGDVGGSWSLRDRLAPHAVIGRDDDRFHLSAADASVDLSFELPRSSRDAGILRGVLHPRIAVSSPDAPLATNCPVHLRLLDPEDPKWSRSALINVTATRGTEFHFETGRRALPETIVVRVTKVGAHDVLRFDSGTVYLEGRSRPLWTEIGWSLLSIALYSVVLFSWTLFASQHFRPVTSWLIAIAIVVMATSFDLLVRIASNLPVEFVSDTVMPILTLIFGDYSSIDPGRSILRGATLGFVPMIETAVRLLVTSFTLGFVSAFRRVEELPR